MMEPKGKERGHQYEKRDRRKRWKKNILLKNLRTGMEGKEQN